MASTYSTRLRLELMANGDQSGTWGTTNNTNIGTLLEEAISGWESIATANADVTLTTSNGATDQARKAVLKFTGALTANRSIFVPAVSKIYIIDNACTGSYSLVVKPSAGSGVTIPNGTKAIVYCDGTNVVDAIVGLPVANGGTGATTASGARTNLGLGSMATQDANNVAITGGNATGLTAVSATTITGTSDRNLKKNIYPLFGALEKVKKLEGVEFTWKSNEKKSLGLIAQDVEEVFPELVHVDGFGFKSIEYGNLVGVLIEAIKELDRKIKG